MNTPYPLTEKTSSGTPEVCFGCRHSYNDVEEGWNCRKYDAVITFSEGSTMSWPGQACARAYSDCQGNGFERGIIPAAVRKYPFVSILVGSILFGFVMASLTFVK